MTRIHRIAALTCAVSALAGLAVAQPAAAASTPTPFPDCPRTITNADNGRTITLLRGQCATLSLDPAEVWDTPHSSSAAVGVFDVPTFAPDQIWGLSAVRDGSATITSTGRPDCDPGEVCPLYIRSFRVDIRVVSYRAARVA
jgi:hypothetical protein